jgi:hypothetical protein
MPDANIGVPRRRISFDVYAVALAQKLIYGADKFLQL